MFGKVPSLVPRSDGQRSGVASGQGVVDGRERCRGVRPLRVATWNIAGGHRSAQAPSAYTGRDQRAAVMAEIARWRRAFGCDVVALQECEGSEGYDELMQDYAFVGAAEAVATRGFVHLYVRRGMKHERIDFDGSQPCVAARVDYGDVEVAAQSVTIAALHLPIGDCAGKRASVLRHVVRKSAECEEKVLLAAT